MFRFYSILVFSLLFWLMLSACAGSPTSMHEFSKKDSPGNFVSEDFLKHHLLTLANDSLLGRGTGQMGSNMTADYLYDFYSSASFSDIGLEVQRQPFTLEGIFWDAVDYTVYSPNSGDTLYLSESSLSPGRSAFFYPVLGGPELIDAPVVFAGLSSRDRSLNSVDPNHPELKDSWVMVFERNDDFINNEKQVHNAADNRRVNYVRSFMRQSGARGMVFISETGAENWEEMAAYMSRQLERPLAVRLEGNLRYGGHSTEAAVSVHPDLAAEMLGFSRTGQLDSLRNAWSVNDNTEPLSTDYYFRNKPMINNRTFEEENILAIIPGSDPELADEILVLSAHYDHMGLGEPDSNNDIVYNGADDNASGTSVLIQIADALRLAAVNDYKPSRTILFLHAAAEEWGLLGSRYYVNNPEFPIENIAANLNVDMVGHIDFEYEDQNDPDYIYVIGAGLISSGLQEIVEEANRASVNITLDDMYNDLSHPQGLYRRSDHWSFGEHNIPFVFFFSGLHDNYHVPSDSPELIAWSQLTRRTKLMTELVWRLAETKDRPVADQERFKRY